VSYGFTSNGYVVKPLDTILSEAFDLLHSIDSRISTTKGTWIWEIYKTWAVKYHELDMTMAQIVTSMNVVNAKGFSLDSWGSEKGIFRKNSAKATCLVDFTGRAVDTAIPIGSRVKTNSGIEYATTQLGILPSKIAITSTGTGTDTIHTPYSLVGGISWCNTSPNQIGTAYVQGVDFTFVSDTITWIGTQPSVNQVFFIGLDQTKTVTTTLAVMAIITGTSSNVSPGQLIVNSTGINGVLSVTNSYSSIGGTDVENDSSYLKRLQRLTNTQYGYGKIASLVSGLDAVRACKVFQDTGVDIATPAFDWTYSSNWAPHRTWLLYAGGSGSGDKIIGQSFVPSGSFITVHNISLHAKKVGMPPALRLSFYTWTTDYPTTISVMPVSSRVFKATDVDPDHPQDWQEIIVPCRYGGLDYTRNYLFTIKNDGASGSATDHWEISYTSGSYSSGAMYVDGTLSGSNDLAFKTRWGGAGYEVVVAVNPGYENYAWQDQVEKMLLDFESKSYGPICIQSTVQEATNVLINVTATVFISTVADWNAIKDRVRGDLATYLLSLRPGENVIFTKVEQIVMSVNGVLKMLSCTIQRNSDTPITTTTQADVLIGPLEVAVLDTGTYGPGVDLAQGSWY
jgi:uncharacterized phage protein gp47/JayE